jgi:tetratricopeptide (TPR) repeat protein
LCFWLSNPSYAHGDLHQRILEVTQEIESQPDSAFLYFKRGSLLFQHETYSESIDDLIISQSLKYTSRDQLFLFAKNYFQLGDYKKSGTYLKKILKQEPGNVNALKLKANIYSCQGRYVKAALTFEDVIVYSSQTFPKNYIDASIAWESAGDTKSMRRAYHILEKGIEDLGELVTLYVRLEELSLANENFDLAIAAHKNILSISNRKESPYYRLSELYLLDGDYEKAQGSLSLAEFHLDKLPQRIKNTAFIQDLKLKILNQKKELKSIMQ